MKSDLNQYMRENAIDAILVTGAGQYNPAMVYLTGGGHMTHCDLIYPADGEPILFCNPMEREEAAKSGYRTVLYSEFPQANYVQQAGGNQVQAAAFRYRDMLRTSGIDQGIVQVYGQVDIGRTYTVFRFLESSNPELHFAGFERGDLVKKAMMRKEATEIDRIRRVGAISVDVVGNVADYLTSCTVEHGKLINEEGEWLTIGAVKRMINLWLAEQGLENPHGSIFAMGRDAGIPHSTGTDTDVLQLGQTIVFDFYPCEPGGGYFHDFTRTWCLGYASDEILRLFEDVLSVYNQIVKSLAVGSLFKEYQQRTCDLFQALGHTTIQSDPACMEGYVHSVGHGVGLNIHEMPFAGINATEDEKLVPGTVFTVEPGLYYPSKGMGVRIEDTFYTSDDGLIDVLAEYPKDLILPMKG